VIKAFRGVVILNTYSVLLNPKGNYMNTLFTVFQNDFAQTQLVTHSPEDRHAAGVELLH